MYDMETRSGLKPVNSGDVPFEITTEQAEDFIQKKFNAITRQARDNGENIEDVKVTLTTLLTGKAFAPFLIVLPTSILKSNNNNKKNRNGKKEELSIFNPVETSAKPYIHDGLHMQLQCYEYTTDDRRVFFDRNWKNALGVTQRDSDFLRYNSTLRIQKLNRGREEFITVLLDPLKVFSDMLENPNNPGKNFSVVIDEFVKVAGGMYKYHVVRVPKSGKNKKKGQKSNRERIAFELQNRMRR